MKEEVKRLKAEVKDVLENNILSFWLDNMQDQENGGFYGQMTGEGKLVKEADKGGILNARVLWSFSAAYRVLRKPEYLEAATRAKDYIIEHGLGFENPTTGELEIAYKYLSGNVREKLQLAKDNNTNGKYDKNIEALEKVIPMDIPAHLIDYGLGASWLPAKLYETYIEEKTGAKLDLKLTGGL